MSIVSGIREEIMSKWKDYLASFVSGIVDGYVLLKYPDWWIPKNIALLVLSLLLRAVPDGVRFQTVGQLGFILTVAMLVPGGGV